MYKNSLKRALKDLDSDQKSILRSFVCITGTTLLGGLIFKSGLSFLLSFIPAWAVFSDFFARKNKSVRKDGKCVAANGKKFTRRDKLLYWMFFWCALTLGVILSPFIALMLPDPKFGIVFLLYIPYVGCTIYGFAKKIPLATFLEPLKSYRLQSINDSPFSSSESFKNDMMTNPAYSYLFCNIHHRKDSL